MTEGVQEGVPILPGTWQKIPTETSYNRLRIAQEEEDEETFWNISTIIQREQQRNFWRRLNYCTGKKKTQSATSIQVEEGGGAIAEHTTLEPVEQTIFLEIHNK